MRYDLTPIHHHLQDTTPSEIVRLLDDLIPELVIRLTDSGDFEVLPVQIIDVYLLRNAFAQISEDSNTLIS